jgi:hypothetical protein
MEVPEAGKLRMLAKSARIVFVLVAVAGLYVACEYFGELYRRVTLPSDLKPVLSSLTPQEVIRRCGAPDGEVMSDYVLRELHYTSSRTSVRFIRGGAGEMGWTFSSMRILGSPGAPDNVRSRLDSLPCLGTAAAAPARN